MKPEVRAQVERVYAEVNAAIAEFNPRCDASGRCCRFKEYDHTLFISAFEAEILLETAPHYDKPVSADSCPFQIDGLCTAREERPLGCRIYFCDPIFESRMQDITESALTQLKQLANEHELAWNYAPLHVFLNAAVRETQAQPKPHTARHELPQV